MRRDWLISRRNSLKKTQESVAGEVGVARTTYASYEQGERTPSVPIAKKIGNVLGFDWPLFFENEVREMCH
ncbi:helix-turn-helix protein [compost metagenome]